MNCLNNSLVENRTEVEAGAGVEVRAHEAVGEGVEVLLPLVGAPGGLLASSSSSPGQQFC